MMIIDMMKGLLTSVSLGWKHEEEWGKKTQLIQLIILIVTMFHQTVWSYEGGRVRHINKSNQGRTVLSFQVTLFSESLIV